MIFFEFICEFFGNWVFEWELCKIVEYIEIFVLGIVVYIYVLIVYDWYCSLVRFYLLKLDGKCVKKMIVMVWFVFVVVIVFYLYMFEV